MNYINEIDHYNSEYDGINYKPVQILDRDDRFPFGELIIRQTFEEDKNDITQIYKKVVLLNSLYSTNIYATFDVALKIFRIDNFSERVSHGDLSLVEEIRRNNISGKNKDFYSFSTKYCHHHNPSGFPIYDSFVEERLIYFLSEYECKVIKSKLKKYSYFKEMMDTLAEKWNLPHDYLYIKLDKYLWKKGKEEKDRKNGN